MPTNPPSDVETLREALEKIANSDFNFPEKGNPDPDFRWSGWITAAREIAHYV